MTARLRVALGPAGIAAAIFLIVVLAVAVAAPMIAPSDPNVQSLLSAFAGPSGGHLLGTDDLGRDILSRLVYGSRTSLLGPALVVAVALLVGIPLALLAAWYGGWVDAIVSAMQCHRLRTVFAQMHCAQSAIAA